MTPEERHRAPALWLVVAAIAGAALVGSVDGAREASGVLALTLAGAGVARLVARGRRPVGIAVRAAWADVMILLTLGAGIGFLAVSSPGVSNDGLRSAPIASDASVGP